MYTVTFCNILHNIVVYYPHNFTDASMAAIQYHVICNQMLVFLSRVK
jgi:hypothetical protein